jgi:endoglucanase
MQPTWGSPSDVAELLRLFDALREFCARNDLPAFVGEFGVTEKKETASRARWMSAVAKAALSRKMVPVLWETGGDISRQPPYSPSPALRQLMQSLSGPAP